ncbi:MAG: class I SAM-dependent methyltransferase [Treponema sp.]|nr:class I SAM-dependent methyltransferase [Treponema sp.]
MKPESYFSDKIRAVDAKFEAQKIAFSPLTFQAVRALLEFGILRKISDSGDAGLTGKEIAGQCGISEYGAGVLTEIALGMGLCKLRRGDSGEQGGNGSGVPEKEERFILGKVGWFLLEDAMSRVNFDFVNDICYKGAFELVDSLRTGRPAGLKVFGEQWKTIYEALSSLPAKAKQSWFGFDHFYSDIAFPEALPLVFASPPRRLFDIGGNTAKWAISCCGYNSGVRVTIIDLPGQTAAAEKNAAAAGFADRIDTVPCDVLDEAAVFPGGADAVWMSQFLDCFSPEQISAILGKVGAAVGKDTDVWVLEPLWDMQRFEASAYSLQATSLYFTCMANGNSKMYRFADLTGAVEKAGFTLRTAHHDLGANAYSLLRFRKEA